MAKTWRDDRGLETDLGYDEALALLYEAVERDRFITDEVRSALDTVHDWVVNDIERIEDLALPAGACAQLPAPSPQEGPTTTALRCVLGWARGVIAGTPLPARDIAAAEHRDRCNQALELVGHLLAVHTFVLDGEMA